MAIHAVQHSSNHIHKSCGYALALACLAVALLALAGCGGGGGSSARLDRKAARERAIASARLTRGAFAIAGIGRTITRAPKLTARRMHVTLNVIHKTRDTPPPDLDPGTGLYFVSQTQLDGSGEEDLFVDASHTMPAGAFVWTAPIWANGVKDTFPATIHTDYHLDQGDFAGEHGTIDFVATDATGDNGTMQVVMTTKENENIISNFTIVNGVIRAKAKCTLPDDTTWTETDVPAQDGGMVCTLDFPDGSTETVTMEPDGSSTETLYDTDGSVALTGDLSENGMDDIHFNDGSQDTVDVDTADAGDGGGSGDDGNNSDSSKAVRRSIALPRRR